MQPKPSRHTYSIISSLTLSIYSQSLFKSCLITPLAEAWFICQLKWVWKLFLKWRAVCTQRRVHLELLMCCDVAMGRLWEEEQSHSVCYFRGQQICEGGREKKQRERQGGRSAFLELLWGDLVFGAMSPLSPRRVAMVTKTSAQGVHYLMAARLSCLYLNSISSYEDLSWEMKKKMSSRKVLNLASCAS